MITLAHKLTHSFRRIVVFLVGQIHCTIDEHLDKFEVPWWVQYQSLRIRVVKVCVVKLGVKPYSPKGFSQKLLTPLLGRGGLCCDAGKLGFEFGPWDIFFLFILPFSRSRIK